VKVFGIIALVLVLFFVIRLLLGAGGGHGPGRHLGGDGATAPSSGQQHPGGVGGPADADQAARTVKVTTLDTMSFEPSRFTVSAGETVTFVVTNTGQAVDELTLGGRRDAAATRRGDGPHACRDGP
jgi:plastocyanin